MKKYIIIALLLLSFVACSDKPSGFTALKDAGQKALLKGDFPQARLYLIGALEKKQSDRDVLYFLGIAYQREYYYDSAFFYFRRADLLHPFDREINVSLLRVAKELNEYETALKAIEVLIKTGDSENSHLSDLTEFNLRNDNPYRAFKYMRMTMANDTSNSRDRYLHLSNIAFQIDSFDFAINLLDEAIEKFGPEKEFVINQAIYIGGQGNLVRAEKILRSVMNQYPEELSIKLNLANILTRQENNSKKREGLELYKVVLPELSETRVVDSAIAALEIELGFAPDTTK